MTSSDDSAEVSLDGGFYVEDDGPGIADKEQDSIFELGYSTAENGIGLSIVKQVRSCLGHPCNRQLSWRGTV